ncbi:MAG: ComF family protein [Alphaproteobacteria bacterium GM7ARS4]|nr:ComF family protein [Alphaproteobacteria bacterium GM7ARS4]
MTLSLWTRHHHSNQGPYGHERKGWGRALESAGRWMADILLPHRCYHCGVVVGNRGLCASCWSNVFFIHASCPCCGQAYEVTPSSDDSSLCLACQAMRPLWRRARSVFFYRGVGRQLILSYKYGNRLDASAYYGTLLFHALTPSMRSCDVLMAVPSHWTRHVWRSYNQAYTLACALNRHLRKELVVGGLVRVKATRKQKASMAYAQRHKRQQAFLERYDNVKDAFRLTPATKKMIKGQSVLLVDDLLTSGATVDACTHTLMMGGAHAVDVVTLARTGTTLL